MSQRLREFDVLVVGSGPGGEGAAMTITKHGLKVAVVEKGKVGGACAHYGTIPSKALRHLAKGVVVARREGLFDLGVQSVRWPQMLEKARKVSHEQALVHVGHYARNNVEVISGTAKFVDSHTICVENQNGQEELLRADKILIATGSKPYRPSHIPFDDSCIFDSDTILSMSKHPRSITILGAGVIGCEYTSIFRAFGVKVHLMNTRKKLLSFLDDEIVDALAYHLRDQGVLIRHDESVAEIYKENDGVVVQLESGKTMRSDVALFAMGRSGNTQNMGLQEIGVQLIENRGVIPVNKHYQTNLEHIYAVGDVTGFPNLASAAYDQGRFAANHMIDPTSKDELATDIPSGIYTIPEISCIGRTEEELTHHKIPYEVGHSAFRHLARSHVCGEKVGMLKILFNPETLEIYGIHCFGENASEILHIGQAVMGTGATLKYFVNTTFNYPTMAEAYRVAALNGLNRVQQLL
ncbi:MAG: Si-specific NAD(P)(+) transhydrogenase [Oligoflexales bacterium]